MIRQAAKLLPSNLREHLRAAASRVMLSPYERSVLSRMKGVSPRECCLCGFKGRFGAFGHPPRYDARCPKCHSLERHRQLALWLDRNPDVLSSDTKVLHFAPEAVIMQLVTRRTNNYKSADLEPGRADLELNIESLRLNDASFDLIICFDVLEHVDDQKALKELSRVLRPGGLVLLHTPFIQNWPETYENSAIQSPAERLVHFGQEDHVRYYGADLRDRIRSVGFQLEEFMVTEPDISRYSLVRGEPIFIARKPV
jgi:SAM-dependent methyltransferase